MLPSLALVIFSFPEVGPPAPWAPAPALKASLSLFRPQEVPRVTQQEQIYPTGWRTNSSGLGCMLACDPV